MVTDILTFLDLKNITDILIIATGLYFLLFFMKKMYFYVVTYIAVIFIIIAGLSRLLGVNFTSQQLHSFIIFSIAVFALMFKRELRQFFDWVVISTIHLMEGRRPNISRDASFVIMKSVQEMAAKKIGALIVMPGELPLDNTIEGGFDLDGQVSVPLMLSIFDTSSPGHDGAVIIDDNRIKKFGVHLPLAENYEPSQKTGTRHRAAVGITERADALVIIVSEERGEISVAQNGELEKNIQPHMLEERIGQFIITAQEPEFDHFWRVFLVKNRRLKLLALILAIFLRLII